MNTIFLDKRFFILQKKIFLCILFLILSLIFPKASFAAQIRIAWDPNVDSALAGYNVYYGTVSGVYGTPIDVGNVTIFTLTGLTSGQTYYIAVTSYTASNESDYSNEVSGTTNDPETINSPGVLSGPKSGVPGDFFTYTVGGSSSNLSHTVEYQFDWKGDGTDLSSWGSSTQSKSWNTTGSYQVRARARCVTHTSVMSNWSSALVVTITIPETVSTPGVPSGSASGTTGTFYSYTSGSSSSNLSHTVEYQFDWKGDGTDLSSWGSSTQSKSWNTTGSYQVRARARCVTHTTVMSNWSSALVVTITIPETVSTPGVPSGSASGTTGTFYSYTSGSSSSNLSHTVEYQFDWKGDGTDLSSWGSSTQSKTWNTTGSYQVRARARCVTHTGIVSNWSSALPVTITIPETVSTPVVPDGSIFGDGSTYYGYSRAPYSFTSGGASSNLGNPVEYQFDWKGDGTDLSSWGSSTQSKTWNTTGTYRVRARARCVTHTSVMSNWSSGLPVTIVDYGYRWL